MRRCTWNVLLMAQGYALHVSGLEVFTSPKLRWLLEQYKKDFPERFRKNWNSDHVTLWMLIPDPTDKADGVS